MKEILRKTLHLSQLHLDEGDESEEEEEVFNLNSRREMHHVQSDGWSDEDTFEEDFNKWRRKEKEFAEEVEEKLWNALIHSRRENLLLKQRLSMNGDGIEQQRRRIQRSPEALHESSGDWKDRDQLLEMELRLKQREVEIQRLQQENQHLFLRKGTLEKQMDVIREESFVREGEKHNYQEKILMLREELDRVTGHKKSDKKEIKGQKKTKDKDKEKKDKKSKSDKEDREKKEGKGSKKEQKTKKEEEQEEQIEEQIETDQ